jgi:hypothetical protein
MPAPAIDPARAVGAGLLYFALVFAVGFALGVGRTVLLEHALGRLAAVAFEVPLLLAASWFICRAVLRRLAISAHPAARLLMGASAFACLMAAEVALGALLAGRTLAEHLALFADPSYALGLCGQILFALIPLLQRPAS